MKKATTRSEDTRFVKDALSYSRLKTFSVCPLLCYEQYIAKTYVEPEHDYFLYGHLVESMLLEPDTVKDKYNRVNRKVKLEDALRYEVAIQNLETELAPLREKALSGNKTAQKGVLKREKEIEDLNTKLVDIKALGAKTQVTGALYDNALATYEAMARNPLFGTMHPSIHTTQQAFYDAKRNIKGIIDYIDFPNSPALQQIYSLWQEKLIDTDEFVKQASTIDEKERIARIIDIKTTARLRVLDPEMYAGQLGLYKRLVESILGVPAVCYVLVGDKDATYKQAQDIIYKNDTLKNAVRNIDTVASLYNQYAKANKWPSAKSLSGQHQECYKCSECKERPFSLDKPLII